jgi:hypothetical protein
MEKQSGRSVWADVIPLLLKHKEFLGKRGAWLALAGFLVLEWLAHASAPVVEQLADPLLSWFGWRPAAGLARSTVELLLPAAVFVCVVRFLGWYVRRQEAPSVEEPVGGKVYPHRGIIASLSWFSVPGGRDPEVSRRLREEIEAALAPAAGSGPNHRARVLRLLYQTNWGPLAAAVELHGPRLRHVWLLCTKEAAEDYKLIAGCIGFLTDGLAAVEPIPVADNNSVTEARLKVHSIYETQVKPAGLRENQVIADMTGGTAAMTAGVILATLDEQRHVEYLSQGPKSQLEGGEPRRDLVSAFQYVKTSPTDVARAFVSFLESRTRTKEES